ncbi:hypothetical protein M0805_002060, partial [Coniferiporia weirii]
IPHRVKSNTDLPISNGFNSIMVVVDHNSSKGIILIPCTKTIDALGTAKCYHDNVYHQFSLPKHIISDRGPQFTSLVFQTLCTHLRIKSKLSMAYHPQTDGQTEQANQEVEAYLRIYCRTAPHAWADSLTDLEFSHNIQTHSVTKTSPFTIMMGYNPIPIPSVIEDTDLPSLSQRLRLLTSIRKEALAAHDLAHTHMARFRTQGFKPFKLGDKVWLEATNLHFPNRSRKLSPEQEGPFSIIQVLSPLNYHLKLPDTWRIHPIFHTALLSTYTETKAHRPPFSLPPPDCYIFLYTLHRLLTPYASSTFHDPAALTDHVPCSVTSFHTLPPCSTAYHLHHIPYHSDTFHRFITDSVYNASITRTTPQAIELNTDLIEDQQEYEVEAIVSHKGNGTRQRFLIKWKGYPSSENQWLSERDLSHAPIILKTYKLA